MELETIATEIRTQIAGMDPTTKTFIVSIEHCKMDAVAPGFNDPASGIAIVVRDWADRLVGLAGIADDIEKNGGRDILFYAPRRSSLITKIADRIEELENETHNNWQVVR
ncbi:MAG: hypothetical protein DRH26_05370 [Deltaproteobacteria bacterium]|nr:MAG: hypothetical protein DRH26_05370 [Deltaproteobacteria bacterium]